ncbi:MAG: hypothetical protein K6T30_09810 [Alicyclobacillus sp.]|nr:hypothetical protein [Alicyclobacillus sp.]
MLHLALKVVVAVVIAVLYTVLIRVRPNGQAMSRSRLASVFVLGLIIGGVFLLSDNLYAAS